MTPAKAIGVADRVWAMGDLIDAALATQPITPVPTAPERRKLFTVIKGGKINRACSACASISVLDVFSSAGERSGVLPG